MSSKLQESVFAAGGTVGALMRSLDWSATALGSADTWPQSLISTVSICLSAPVPIAVYWGPEFILLYNDAWLALEGDRQPRVLGQPVQQVRPDLWEALRSSLQRAFHDGVSAFAEQQLLASIRHGHVEECYFDYGVSPIRGEDERIVGIFMIAAIANGHGHDRTRSALRSRLDKIASVTPVAIFEMHTTYDGKVSLPYSTPAIAHIYGHTPEELSNDASLAASLTHPEDRERIAATLYRHIQNKTPIHDEWRVMHPAKGQIWVEIRCTPAAQHEDGLTWYGYFHDITARKKMEETLHERVLAQQKRERQIRFLACHDALTRLPNRSLLLSRLRQAIAHSQRSKEALAVMFLDVDRFKTINDTLGHPAGDTLLQQISRRLTETLRVGDTVARAGGDEFLLLVPGLHTAEDAGPVAEHVLASLSAPFVVAGQTVRASGSVGLAICPRDAADVENLIKYADTALYLAKAQGRNTFRCFSPELDARVRARMHLENELRLAVDRDQFVLHYQPQIELATGRVIGVEALIRWLHPQRGLVAPAAFIPTAEETGLILPIGEWALRTACLQARAWYESGRPPLRVAVNISGKQLNGADIAAVVRRTLSETHCNPRMLGLEITEAAVMGDPRDAVRVIHSLHELGVEVSIDDFGTGYSSMAYLKRFALDRLKIDATFVRGTPEDKDNVAIVQAILALARQFRLRVTAEGVETAAQRTFLRAQQCDAIQGFLVSAPLPGQDLNEMLGLVTA